MLVSILGRCISIYRNLKRNRTYVKREGSDTQDEKETHNDENV